MMIIKMNNILLHFVHSYIVIVGRKADGRSNATITIHKYTERPNFLFVTLF